MCDGNYIKINRKILDWEWYSDINTKVVFFHMLLKANWREAKFKGTTVPRGSFISSIGKLSEETHLTAREIRTAISHLKSTGEVTSQTTNRYTIFTVNNYDLYQSNDKPNGSQATIKRQPNDNLTTTIEEYKEEKKKRKKSVDKSTPEKTPAMFVDDEIVNQAIIGFVEYRKESKKPMTEAAIRLLVNKLNKLSGDRDEQVEILRQSIMCGYQGIFPLKENNRKKRTLDESIEVGKEWLHDREGVFNDCISDQSGLAQL